MKTCTKLLCLLMVVSSLFWTTDVKSQAGVLDPNDPIVVYSPANPPATPPFGTMAKWVKTNRLNWNTSSFKAYFYKNVAFRLKFPKTYQHGVADGKTYPVFVFFHGIGERGTIYDNEFQLYHGGERHRNAVDNGEFDGFLLYIQSSTPSGSFGSSYYSVVNEIIQNYMVPQVKADINRILVNGLSAGGSSVWEYTINNPKLVAGSLPISAVSVGFANQANTLKYIPMWHFQGGLDNNPTPGSSQYVGGVILNAGGNYRYKEYPTQGHGCWNSAWAEADYFPFLSRQHKANPWALGGRTEFCPGDPINITLGVTAGFDGYEWKRNNQPYGGNSHQINVTTVGTYECRIRRGSTWSEWSPIPVVIKIKEATVPPQISVSGLMSKVIPALDGNNGVTIQVPEGYSSYLWQRIGSGTTLGTSNTLNVTVPGDYRVRVSEQFGCASEYSVPFTVINANGPNKPDAAINLAVSTISKTSLRLDWSDNPSPTFNETNFEIYQATQAGGPFTLVAIKNADVLNHTVTDLNAGTEYFYKVRAVNNFSAANASNEASGTTASDTQPPLAPTNLTITGSTKSSISLTWNAATDDVGVEKYEVFVNGIKSYVTTQTNYTIFNLQHAQNYTFTVKARDLAGNLSPFSNQVSGQPLLTGLNVKYYTFSGTWNNLPDFNTLTPVFIKNEPNVSLSSRTQEDNFAYLWEGYIVIPSQGSYQFRTRSDDGSRLYIGPLNGTGSPYSFSGPSTVNNDGLHGPQDATSSNIELQPGVYPFAATFYEQGGGAEMSISWRLPGTSNFVPIPNSAFSEPPVVNGQAPADPSSLIANAFSFKRIDLNWTDNSNNEAGFEIWRSTDISNNFTTVGIAPANATSYIDSTLDASTTYYYKIRAVNQYGESQLVSSTEITQANWKFNGNYSDASGYNRVVSPANNPGFDATDKMEGSHSLSFNGGNQELTISTSANDYLRGVYNKKTVAFWMKSNSNTSNRFLFDIGGSDDGLAVRLDGNRLYVGVASNNTRRNFFIPYTSTDWNHVAVVYNGNTLKLFLNGVEVAANNNLGFTATTTTTSASLIGYADGANAFGSSRGRFNGRIDDFGIYDEALNASAITALMNNVLGNSYATTHALPVAPAAPDNLLATAVSNSKVEITWSNVANETGYELYRSSNNNSTYVFLASLNANITSYTDSSLFSNAIYYYKIRSKNIGGFSGYSNEDSAKTRNNIPVITAIDNQFMRFGTNLQLNVQAVDADPEVLNISVTGLPGFANFVSTGNGLGTINITNAVLGVYNDITVTVTDQNGGEHAVSFNLTVNDNYVPVINAVNNVTLNEQEAINVNLSATDQNAGDVLSWSFNNLPDFISITTNNNSAQLQLAPGFADNGSYKVNVKVEDGNNGTDTISFNITVNDVNPNKKIYVNFTDGSLQAPAPWNNTNKIPVLNDVFGNLLDETGANSGLSLKVTSSWQNVGNGTNVLGVNTTSGIYPMQAIRSAYWSNSNQQSLLISGLNPSNKYNFTFFGSRAATDNRTTIYTIGGNSVELNAANNTQNTISVNNLSPAGDGTLTLTIKNATGSAYSYLNAMVVESIFDDGSAPARPRDLSAEFNSGAIYLNWVDAAYNEDTYEVYRSTALHGVYTLLNPGGNNANLQEFVNNNVAGNTTYYYTVRATNTYGNSLFSDTVSVITPNTSPVLNTISDVKMKTTQVVNVNVVATDDAADVVTLTVTGLPSFASFIDNGNGTGTINIAPGSTMGTFNDVVVVAKDDKGAENSVTFKIIVSDKDITSMYVNFNQVVLPVDEPWNSFNTLPLAGRSITNLKDDNGNTTAASITLVDGWQGANDVGATTGNNTGVFPDNVMKTAYFESTSNTKRIRISGLTSGGNTKYNLVFFASRIANDTRNTIYTANGTSVTLNAGNNYTTTAQINGLTADANGVIEFTAQKAGNSSFAYINALVIQSYIDNGIPLAPANLTAVAKSKTTIQLEWNDKSNNEDGFQVYRSLNAAGPYSLITTTGANVTTFLDQGLVANTVYHYKVRAKKVVVFSSYSNVASSSTFSYSLYVNFNRENPAAAPWNNTNNVPMYGSVYSNFLNDQNNPTGINMEITKNFSGDNPFGVNTGNNSGVFPDNVIRSTWWLDPGEGYAELKLSGLSQSMAYSFVFFGSREGTSGNRVTVYTINGKTASLECLNNVNRTAQIDNIRADDNGEVFIRVSLGPVSQFAYIGAMVVHAYQAPAEENGGSGGSGSTQGGGDPVVTMTEKRMPSQEVPQMITNTGVFPNPFVDQVTLSAKFENSQEYLTIHVMDAQGRIIMATKTGSVNKGQWNYKLNLSNKAIQPGMYLIRVQGSDHLTPPISFKVVKNR